MAKYQIEMTEEANEDLRYYVAYERKIIISEIRAQLEDQPSVETKNRKKLRDNPIATWELRSGKYRIFYEVDENSLSVSVVAAGHKEHNVLFIKGDMITVDLEKDKVDLAAVMSLAKREPVLILASDGTEFLVSEADDFDQEIEALRASSSFQKFLDERAASTRRIPLEEIEKEIDRELRGANRTP